jgi:hypothetical protein
MEELTPLTPLVWIQGCLSLTVSGRVRVIWPGDVITDAAELSELGPERISQFLKSNAAEILAPGVDIPAPMVSADERGQVSALVQENHDFQLKFAQDLRRAHGAGAPTPVRIMKED